MNIFVDGIDVLRAKDGKGRKYRRLFYDFIVDLFLSASQISSH